MKFFVCSVLTAFVVLTSGGCAHLQLQRNSVRQSNTVSDIYEQQVLDNLAKFVNNPHATPSFSIAFQATNGVTDSGDLGISDGALLGRFWGFLSASASRDEQQNFTLNPVTDPARLLLMQCAYQRAVGLQLNECDKCCEYLIAWTGNQDACVDACGIKSGWVCQSDCLRDVPKSCCNSYGKDCDTYVWVDPCQRQEFSKLVMTIIDYAAGSRAAGKGNKKVTLYLDADGEFAKKGKHVQEVEALVPVGLSHREVEKRLNVSATEQAFQAKLSLRDQVSNTEPEKMDMLVPQLMRVFPETMRGAAEAQMFAEGVEDRSAMKNELLNLLNNEISTLPMSQPVQETRSLQQPSINFGPPTQFNGALGGGLLQQQQLLDTVRPPRN